MSVTYICCKSSIRLKETSMQVNRTVRMGYRTEILRFAFSSFSLSSGVRHRQQGNSGWDCILAGNNPFQPILISAWRGTRHDSDDSDTFLYSFFPSVIFFILTKVADSHNVFLCYTFVDPLVYFSIFRTATPFVLCATSFIGCMCLGLLSKTAIFAEIICWNVWVTKSVVFTLRTVIVDCKMLRKKCKFGQNYRTFIIWPKYYLLGGIVITPIPSIIVRRVLI